MSTEPQFWRMQLHPECETLEERKDCTDLCLKGPQPRIGLDFKDKSTGDLRNVDPAKMSGQANYYAFYKPMDIGDVVLIFISSVPYALVRVTGEYEYGADPNPDEVWCAHHRKVHLLAYIDEHKDQLHSPDDLRTSAAIQRVEDKTGPVYKFIKAWFDLTK